MVWVDHVSGFFNIVPLPPLYLLTKKLFLAALTSMLGFALQLIHRAMSWNCSHSAKVIASSWLLYLEQPPRPWASIRLLALAEISPLQAHITEQSCGIWNNPDECSPFYLSQIIQGAGVVIDKPKASVFVLWVCRPQAQIYENCLLHWETLNHSSLMRKMTPNSVTASKSRLCPCSLSHIILYMLDSTKIGFRFLSL